MIVVFPDHTNLLFFITYINPGYRTHHSSNLLQLRFIYNEWGRGCWKFNNSLLKNKDYIKLVKDTIHEVIDTYKK